MLQRLTVAVGVMLFLTSLSAAQDRNTFRVGTASAARGQKVTGTIEVPAGYRRCLKHSSRSDSWRETWTSAGVGSGLTRH